MFRSLGAGMITNKLLDCKTVVFFALVIRMRAVFERKVWSECEYEEWEWGACEARARARGHPNFRCYRRFAPLRASQRKKPTVLQSKFGRLRAMEAESKELNSIFRSI